MELLGEDWSCTRHIGAGLAHVRRNHLNLLDSMAFEDTRWMKYVYDAAGIKLMRITYDSLPNSEDTTHYVGPFHYGNNQLDFWFAPEGRILNEDTVFAYEYVLTDHLGNTRATFVEDGGTALLTQSNHYYPFGLEIASLNYQASPGEGYDYLYNGKEKQRFNGLDWYDFGARFYDEATGRWFAVDPLAEHDISVSSYVYTINNPVKYIDPNGMLWADPDEAANRRSQVADRMQDIRTELEAAENTDTSEMTKRELRKHNRNLKNLKDRLAYLGQSLRDFDAAGQDPDHVYSFGKPTGDKNYVHSDDGTNVTIYADNLAGVVHELSHVGDAIRTGIFRWSVDGYLSYPDEFSTGEDYERLAYSKQWAYSPSSIPNGGRNVKTVDDIDYKYIAFIKDKSGNYIYERIYKGYIRDNDRINREERERRRNGRNTSKKNDN